ncbi:MAG: hypothetical protein HHJ15_10765 [Rhodoferax sp.]|uniref:hypothetical protein n=1 Tax=Rhodoferax sp. TaxID=50421 RepID=UPI0017BAC5DD|nr:hypothetical protein [Rhodoferax sp.]NMM20415.1 hypothetical protein [Rhodoferax sp.]
MSLALVYLARGADGGLPAAKAFFKAYHVYPPRCPHELIVITKGWSGIAGRNELEQLAQANSARLVDLPDDGFDWGAYMRLAPLLTHTWVCFLNTHSRPCVDGWLNLLKVSAEAPGMNIGAVGATASWQTLAPVLPLPSVNAEYNNPLIYPLRLIRNTVRFVTNIRDFPSFPNPHLRSNAFIVRRELFVDFAAAQQIPRCKRDALKLESGRVGFTAFLGARGLKMLVAGADSRVYGSKEWVDSGIFRAPGQPNLLVADNQTIAYDMADNNSKRNFEKSAWGRILTNL